ncbi:unnamed protein product [Adineta ricciae]|uniref:2-phosphoxylose phosphatase 1 n=1 Tax=Adineta ricciae TaxID=249248 RepID=A0A813PR35_ADIRI|nr:unnamed protein product [Adineta ricciae]CAF1084911.1 unnamed protein product [Adineta ricciae]
MERSKARSDLQLIGAQIIFRHGARTPLFLMPSLEEVIYSNEHVENYAPAKWDIKLITKRNGVIVAKENISSADDKDGKRDRQLKSMSGLSVRTGQLTAIGERQLFQLGKLIRSELIDPKENAGLIPATYDPQYVYCRSTYMDRTISSARAFLAGLFTSDEKDHKIQATGPFEIEVNHFPDEDLFPNTNVYPILKNCPNVITLYESFNDDHDMKRARQRLLNRIGAADQAHGIVELYDDIVSRRAHNFSVPDDILHLVKDFEVMSAREFVYRATDIGFDVFLRSGCGPLLSLIRENFNSILKNYREEKTSNTKKPFQRFFIYSAHDSTIIPLAMAFEIFQMRWPEYADYIFLEYFVSRTNPDETYVTVNFAGELQVLPNCEDYYCPYSTFLTNLEKRFQQTKISV